MNVRRIVTGHSETGASVFISDGMPPGAAKFEYVPGMEVALAWKSAADGLISRSGDQPTNVSSVVPAAGETTLLLVTFPPDSVRTAPTFDRAAAGVESKKLHPGLAESFEPDAPGMHTTETVDYGILLEGELSLELDGGATKRLNPHDIVIQNGTRHAWRNSSRRPATMPFVLIGGHRG